MTGHSDMVTQIQKYYFLASDCHHFEFDRVTAALYEPDADSPPCFQ